MRYMDKRPSEEDTSAQSSVQSIDSYEIFGSACSESSDCEYCDKRKHRYNKINNKTPYQSCSLSNSASNSLPSVMDVREGAPLLPNTAKSFVYKSLERNGSTDTLGPGDFSSCEMLATYKKQTEKKPDKKKQSSLITIFSVWNTVMGSSLLTMAWGVERAGLPTALVMVAVMAALCLYTAYILLDVNYYHGSATCEVPALSRQLLGPAAEVVAHAFSLLVLLGSNIVYWILITNFLYFTVNYLTDPFAWNVVSTNGSVICPEPGVMNMSVLSPEPAGDSPYWGLHTTVPLYVALIVFPLLNFRNVSFFTKFNSLGTLSVMYLVIFVIVKGASWGINMTSVSSTHVFTDAAVLSGMLALSFYIHNIIITIMNNNATQDKYGRDLTIAFVLVTLTYMLVGVVFYVCFPLAKICIQDNILNNFEIHDIMTAVARILLLFQVVTVYPLVAFMLRSEAILLLPLREEVKQKRWPIVTVNAAVVFMCIMFACFCPNIGTIIRYTGAVSGLVHIFTLPSLLQIRSLQIRGKLKWWKTVFYIAIIIIGTVNLLMQFFITE